MKTTSLTILSSEIRQLDDLYSLNDIHKAAGGNKNHQPANFLRLDTTQALIAELCSSDLRIMPVNKITGRGKQQGTYVCRELVIAYAAWISAAFHLKVIQVFLSQSKTGGYRPLSPQPDRPAKRYDYPRALLQQEHFTGKDRPAGLHISMLADRKFVSPLLHLLNELRVNGHDVSAVLDEAEAMREAIVRADEAFSEILEIALRAQNRSSSKAGKSS